jgi:hypothetical protein
LTKASKRFDIFSLAVICGFVSSPRAPRQLEDLWETEETDEAQFPSIPLNYERTALHGIARWAFPTVCLGVDIRQDPRGERSGCWVTSHRVQNGRFGIDVRILSERGELVATSKHVCLMISRKVLADGVGEKAVLSPGRPAGL